MPISTRANTLIGNIRSLNDSQLADLRNRLFKTPNYRPYAAALLRGTKTWANSETTALTDGDPVKTVFNISDLTASDISSLANAIYKEKDTGLRNVIFGLIRGSKNLANSTKIIETIDTAPAPIEGGGGGGAGE